LNIYVETNFVLELVFEQEQSESCEKILQLAEANRVKLTLPAYSLAEPHEKLNRQATARKKLQDSLNIELRQLSRSKNYTSRIESIRDLDAANSSK
jgi:predicted nucleic acid-binding protein